MIVVVAIFLLMPPDIFVARAQRKTDAVVSERRQLISTMSPSALKV